MALSVMRRGPAAALPMLKTTLKVCTQAERGIVTKEFRDPNWKRPAPFPYETKNYNIFRALFDDVTHRFDENTKIIIVDGPPTGNKEKFARYMADKFDMKYIPDADMDMWYLDDFGVDLRCLNPKVHPCMRTLDIHQWLQKPHHYHTARLQQDLMISRFVRYFDAHNHLLNTGQGVVCHRSLYSDIAFARTILDQGWMRKEAFQYLEDSKALVIDEFLRPHVVVYCDMAPETVCANAEARNEPGEKNSPFFTPEVQANLAKNYRELVLKPLSEHAEVLVYDWNHPDIDYDAILDDITELDFSQYTKYHEKMNDWTMTKGEWNWKNRRARFNKFWGHQLKTSIERVPMRDIPELFPHPNELEAWMYHKAQLPSQKFSKGYNAAMGDKVGFFS